MKLHLFFAITLSVLSAVSYPSWFGPGIVNAAQAPVFDVASIRRSGDPSKEQTFRVTPTGINLESVSLLNCLEEAYGVTPHQISGPSWMRTDRFDIIARTSAPMTRGQMMARLQTLLADRFRLSLHREQRESRALTLVVAKGGPRLMKASGDGDGRREPAPGIALRFVNTSMPELAHYLGRQGPVGAPVVDETNLAGRFDFVLTFVPPSGSGDHAVRAMAEGKMALVEGGMTSYRDALAGVGLDLESRRMPIDVIVVDRAERVPTAN